MTGEGDGRGRLAAMSAKNLDKDVLNRDNKRDARQDRLKLALRENLKRRKSQARGRDDLAAVAPDRDDDASYAEGDKADRDGEA
jgi:hypothetical protein